MLTSLPGIEKAVEILTPEFSTVLFARIQREFTIDQLLPMVGDSKYLIQNIEKILIKIDSTSVDDYSEFREIVSMMLIFLSVIPRALELLSVTLTFLLNFLKIHDIELSVAHSDKKVYQAVSTISYIIPMLVLMQPSLFLLGKPVPPPSFPEGNEEISRGVWDGYIENLELYEFVGCDVE